MQIPQVGEKSGISWRVANYSTNQAWFNNVSGGKQWAKFQHDCLFQHDSYSNCPSKIFSLIFICVNCESNANGMLSTDFNWKKISLLKIRWNV